MGFAQSGTPTIDPNLGVQNQGNFKAGESVASGSFVAIFGTNIASSLTLADTVPLSNQLANVSVTFNNVPAPMVAVGHNVNAAGDDQINAQVPWEVTPGTAQVVVTRGNASSAAANVSIGGSSIMAPVRSATRAKPRLAHHCSRPSMIAIIPVGLRKVR